MREFIRRIRSGDWIEIVTPDGTRGRTDPHYIGLYVLTVAIALFPVLTVNVPPLVDYSNHLARNYIISNIAGTPHFNERFELLYQPIPNLAMEFVTVPLIPYIGVESAGSIFILATIVLFAVGCFLIASYAAPAGSNIPIGVVFFPFGFTLFYGFINYLFGISVFLVTFGLWLRWRNTPSFPAISTHCLTSLAYFSISHPLPS